MVLLLAASYAPTPTQNSSAFALPGDRQNRIWRMDSCLHIHQVHQVSVNFSQVVLAGWGTSYSTKLIPVGLVRS